MSPRALGLQQDLSLFFRWHSLVRVNAHPAASIAHPYVTVYAAVLDPCGCPPPPACLLCLVTKPDKLYAHGGAKKKWLCPNCAKKVIAAADSEETESSSAEANDAANGKGTAASSSSSPSLSSAAAAADAARKEKEMDELRLAALAVLDESSEDPGDVRSLIYMFEFDIRRGLRGDRNRQRPGQLERAQFRFPGQILHAVRSRDGRRNPSSAAELNPSSGR